MKKTIIMSLGLCGAIMASASIPRPGEARSTVIQEVAAGGTMTATVRHVETGAPLPNLPVTVYRVDTSDGGTPTKQVITNKLGVAVFTGLANGAYEAVVIFNNHTSNVERFVINDDSGASVALFFHPDIDE